MVFLGRIFALLATVIVAAQPVMACCIEGHSAPVILAEQNVEPPCHDDGMPMAADPGAQAGHERSDCPGCYDCEFSVMQSQSAGGSAVLPAMGAEFALAPIDANFPGFAHRSIVQKTGPPSVSLPRLATPITLKQRLLI